MMNLPLSIGLGFIFAVLILMSLSGNALVCAAIFLDRRLRHQHENLFLISLAVSDLLVSVLVMLPAAVNDILSEWVFGNVYCSLWFSFDIAGCTASILNLCAIAFDRYMHISAPMLYTRSVTKRKILYLIILVWCVSLTIGFLPRLFTNFSSDDNLPLQNNGTNGTKLKVCQLELKPVFAIISSSFSFYIPASVMVIAYGKLYLYARKHVIAMQQQRKHIAAEMLLAQWTATLMAPADRRKQSNAVNTIGKSQHVNRRMSRAQEASQHISRRRITTQTKHKKAMKEHKARITLGVIIGVFLFCWLPFFIVNVIRSLLPDFIPTWLFLAVTWLGYANSTANPVIYTVLNRDFRSAFHKILLHVFPKKHQSRRRYRPPKTEYEQSVKFAPRPVKFKTFAAADNCDHSSVDLEDVSRSFLAANNTNTFGNSCLSSSPQADQSMTEYSNRSSKHQHGSRLSLCNTQEEKPNFYRRPRHHTITLSTSPQSSFENYSGKRPRRSLPAHNTNCKPPDERTALVEKHQPPYGGGNGATNRSMSSPPANLSTVSDIAPAQRRAINLESESKY